MAVAMMVENPEASEEIYERVRALIGAQRPESCILHVAGPSPKGGFRVIELWDSEEEASRFFVERCLPAFEAVGVPVPPPPEFWPVHNRMYGERTNGRGETGPRHRARTGPGKAARSLCPEHAYSPGALVARGNAGARARRRPAASVRPRWVGRLI